MDLSIYWTSVFILPKSTIRQIEKRLRYLLWKGATSGGYVKQSYDVLICDRTSIWVEWLYHGRLCDRSIWTISEHGGLWGWRKLLRLRTVIRPLVDYQVGDGATFYSWQDPWHPLGPLIQRLPRGPQLTGLGHSEKLNRVIVDGYLHWASSRTCLEIVQNLPIIHGDDDRVHWRDTNGCLTVAPLYRILHPPGPKLGWTSLLSGSLKIPRYTFILWLAILGKLSITDKLWLSYLGTYVLCDEGAIETHAHLLFQCFYARRYLIAVTGCSIHMAKLRLGLRRGVG
ncbi:UNVERIFIED_CONTAM: hypothetical protein Sindi_2664200 [Sesamum indicum]